MQLTVILRYLPDILLYIKHFCNDGIKDNEVDGTCIKHEGLQKTYQILIVYLRGKCNSEYLSILA
jgi:hypothetical protein